uniref:YeeE/YedE family protein n=1 Tax=Alexandrium catenella TaxID=2925 RepID=A0A7S1MQW3_ALECA
MVASCATAALLLAAAVVPALRRRLEAWKLALLIELVSGLFFGVGLAISGMARPSKVAAFLDLRSGSWDPSLAFVMGSALMLTFPFFQALDRREGCAPLVGSRFEFPPKSKPIDTTLVAGAMLFGIGWGLAGACPGPVWVLLLAVPSLEIAMLWVGMFAGMGVWAASQPGPSAPLLAADPEAATAQE